MADEKDIEILSSYGYTAEQIIDTDRLRPDSLASAFIHYIEQDMANTSNPFRVNPFHIFLVRNEQPNAWAIFKNNRYLIVIHHSVIEHVGKFIFQRFKALFKPDGILNQLILTYTQMDLPTFVFQLVTLYIYNHELAHLNQYKNLNSKEAKLQQESSILITDPSFNIVSHAMEIDADIFASTELAFSLREFWNQVSVTERSTDLLEAFIALLGAAIFWFWQTLNGGWSDIYFVKSSHPHVLVRVTYIIDCMTSVLKGAGDTLIPFDRDRCQLETLSLVGKLAEMDNDPGLKNYLLSFQENVEDFEIYSKEYIVPESKKLPFLVQWNWPLGRF